MNCLGCAMGGGGVDCAVDWVDRVGVADGEEENGFNLESHDVSCLEVDSGVGGLGAGGGGGGVTTTGVGKMGLQKDSSFKCDKQMKNQSTWLV